jgi:uncharacterized membrane protein
MRISYPMSHVNPEKLAHESLAPMIFASGIACSMVVTRVVMSDSWAYAHMVWNLWLAWIPYLCALAMEAIARAGGRWSLLPVGAIWLPFLPNAPYLVTDFVHLLEIPAIALWYDIGMLAIFAWTGGCLTAASLRSARQLVVARAGRFTGDLFVLLIAILGGFGVYLGRFQRWNSWDVVLDPGGLLADVAARLMDPAGHPRMIGVTGMFAALILVCYLTHPRAR